LVSRKYNYVYPYCVGGKTGYTDDARYTLVTLSEKDGMTLICVVLRTEAPHQWEDSIALFDYAFDNFQLFNVAENETNYNVSDKSSSGSLNTNEAFVDIDRTAEIVLPKTAEFSDAGSEIVYDSSDADVAGIIRYTYADRVVGEADIVRTGVKVSTFAFDNEEETIAEEEAESDVIRIRPWMVAAAIVGVAVLVVLIIVLKHFIDNFYIIRHNREVKKERREQFRKIKKKKRRHKRRGEY
jgi:D-alanyl-D-alanine carboxypeptidase